MSVVALVVVLSFMAVGHFAIDRQTIGKLTTSVCSPIEWELVWQNVELEDDTVTITISIPAGHNGDKTVSAKGKGNKTCSAIETETETESETETVLVNLKIPLKNAGLQHLGEQVALLRCLLPATCLSG